MYAYLTITEGPQSGRRFVLDASQENRLGRDRNCAVALDDALCSRVHATIQHEAGRWQIHDGSSLNGTFVNGQKIDQAVLDEGHRIRIGSSELEFHHSTAPPAAIRETVPDFTDTIVREAHVEPGDTSVFAAAAIGGSEHTQDLLLLYQLSIKLLACSDPHEVLQSALGLLYERLSANVVGFLWIDDEGQLKPNHVSPESYANKITLSSTLTRMVLKEGRAVWTASQPQQSGSVTSSLANFADALCVPMQHAGRVVGAIHIYLDRGRFRQSQFDFSISLANIAAVALVRARQDAQLSHENRRLRQNSPGYDDLIGESPGMRTLKDRIDRVAKASGCVLVRGESGSGKELVARAVHRRSQRADRPMLSINCAAISENLIESQLFGHKAGSFTGADRDHVGYFQQADMGTLFLDEVGELTLQAQAKLLRVLEGHPFMPVGSTTEIKVDVRLIAATNQDLAHYVREKKFREDLYYRLSVFELEVPPLRERGDDKNLLIDFFLGHFSRQHGRANMRLGDDARKLLTDYHWPGNVRQLRNVLDSAVVLAADDTIDVGDLMLRDSGSTEYESLQFSHWERKLIQEALRRTEGNIPEAAKLLGIGRATLYRKLDEYGIKR